MKASRPLHMLGRNLIGAHGWIVYGAVFSVVCILSSVMGGSDAHAALADNSRLQYGNVGAYCNIGNQVKGMVWLSNQPDYYSEKVVVSEFDTSVPVSVRGGGNICGPTRTTPRQLYAINVSSSDPAVLWLSDTWFWRGSFNTGNAYEWSTEGGRLSGSLNVNGVAPCSASGGTGMSVGSIYVKINRQQRVVRNSDGKIYDNGWGEEAFFIRLERTCPTINFTLNPSVSVTPGQAEPGAPINVTPTVNNTGPTPSSSAQWQVRTFTVTPAGSIPAGGVNGTQPQSQFPGSTLVNSYIGSNPSPQVFPVGNTNLSISDAQNVPDLPVGTRICYVLSVQPYRHDDARWNHGTPRCITVGKSPKVQVLGGDLQVGRGSSAASSRISDVMTSASVKGANKYGSWAEYAIVPTGCVTNMASGAGYAGGASSGATLESLSLLTFTVPGRQVSTSPARTCSVGGYAQTNSSPDVASRFPVIVSATAATPSRPARPAVLGSSNVNLSALSGAYQPPAGATSLNISASAAIASGRQVIINAKDIPVTITSDIRYTTGGMSALGDIPQVVIIAKNIIIADTVSQIDSWLVATGTDTPSVKAGNINTCGAGAVSETSALTYRDCATQLVVNGPVIANHLILRRTFGSGMGAASGTPAEIFNLRADSYIWATAYNLNTGRLSTVATKELPPRF